MPQQSSFDGEPELGVEAQDGCVRVDIPEGGELFREARPARLRLVYPEGVPSQVLTPEGFASALSGYLDLSTPTRTGLAEAARAAAGAAEAAIASLRPGLSRSEVETLLGPPFETVRRQEGDRLVRVASFRSTKGTIQAVFEANLLLRWTLEPR